MNGVGLIVVGVLLLLSIPIVSTDMKERRIPNLWNLTLGIAGLLIALIRAPHLKPFISAGLD